MFLLSFVNAVCTGDIHAFNFVVLFASQKMLNKCNAKFKGFTVTHSVNGFAPFISVNRWFNTVPLLFKMIII